MEHIWTSEDGVRWRNTPDRVYCYVNFAGRGFEIDMGVPDKRDREILRLAAKNQRLTQSSLASSNAFQEDLAALLRAAGLSDRARPASPHQVVQEELLPQVQYLAARERVLSERVTMLEKQIQEQRVAIRQEILDEIGSLTRYVTWDEGERRGRPTDEPFITAAEVRSVLDRVIPEE